MFFYFAAIPVSVRSCVAPTASAFLLIPCFPPCLCWLGRLCLQVAQSRGKRCSAASSYLKEAMGRKNLDVETGAQITKVVGGFLRGLLNVFICPKHYITTLKRGPRPHPLRSIPTLPEHKTFVPSRSCYTAMLSWG